MERDENSRGSDAGQDNSNMGGGLKPFSLTRMMPHCWKNKESGAIAKVVPWFQPLDESRWDFKDLLKGCDPRFTDDILGNFEVYSGLCLHTGWQFENDHNVWFCLPKGVKDQFEDLGPWDASQPYAQERRLRLDTEYAEAEKEETKKEDKP